MSAVSKAGRLMTTGTSDDIPDFMLGKEKDVRRKGTNLLMILFTVCLV
jgi:hypothetical protein